MRILLLFYNPILQIITLQCVGGYKQKTPRYIYTPHAYIGEVVPPMVSSIYVADLAKKGLFWGVI